jgi:hypothetical protein
MNSFAAWRIEDEKSQEFCASRRGLAGAKKMDENIRFGSNQATGCDQRERLD